MFYDGAKTCPQTPVTLGCARPMRPRVPVRAISRPVSAERRRALRGAARTVGSATPGPRLPRYDGVDYKETARLCEDECRPKVFAAGVDRRAVAAAALCT